MRNFRTTSAFRSIWRKKTTAAAAVAVAAIPVVIPVVIPVARTARRAVTALARAA